MADDEVTVTVDPGPSPEGVTVTATTASQDAPWGYKADGTPYQRDPARYKARSARQATQKGPAKGRSKGKAPDYTSDVAGVVQLVTVPLALAGQRNPVFLADAFVIGEATPTIAGAVNEVAQSDPRVAALLERLGKVGPYGVLITAITPVAIQVMANHRVIPPGVMGAHDPEEILAHLEAEGRKAAGEPAPQAA